ncbi:c-type cytochrome [Maribacter algarum]|uniref:C-type cytochrome n=1 Tax=Maribacter algarum (ex Zhang et al. 2020) TaxID=2578118 RepID=A0A5S3PTH1_9FLAO|nr:cytochrome c3 family protein [Maribacter algarum]TMM58286.1 c-type cytochrome [Maribacter algarum]
MKKVTYRNQISKVLGISLVVFLLSSISLFAQNEVVAEEPAATEDASSGDAVKGKQLFNQNCAACHALNRKMTGPALANVEARLAEDEGLDREWLYAWIKNSPGMIKSGDAYAVKIYNEYNQAAMTAFPTLSNADIDNILAYTVPVIDNGGEKETKTIPIVSNEPGISNEIILGALVLVFALLVMMLFLVNKTLRRIAEANGVVVADENAEERTPIWKAFAKNQFLVLCTVIFLLLGSGYFAYGWMMQVGVDQGYAPIQPIHYSHKIHAGTNKIECKYCHSSARKSKHSGIPSLNVCMNCHKSIYEYTGVAGEAPSQEDLANGYTNDFYTGEIKKLYAAVGWDEENQKYTGDTKPVEWVRIHNLPDFAYFNHSQHVEVGKIECQTCHGPVEEMEIMYQYSPLTMGWCINCHRETNVQVEGNEYYAKIHEELSKKYGVETLTAAQMGGLECGKCHY